MSPPPRRKPEAAGRRLVVGLDLGTSHTVVAWADPATARAGRAPAIHVFDLEQLVGPGQVAARPLLPSRRYHARPGELQPQDVALPWGTPPDDLAADRAPDAPPPPPAGAVVLGTWARELSAQSPGRGVASAKSWLSHAAVDRWAPILPWGAADDVPKVSPLRASASVLAHVRAAWNAAHPQQPLEAQHLVLTVPASFDDTARTLTLEAARLAGLGAPSLFEEPQAAFADWMQRHRDRLGEALAGARLVLVCDVGGGTTDVSLIRAEPGTPMPRLTRIAVGPHLMLGGDNMDLALAHLVERRLAGDDPAAPRLDAAQLAQLVERCRSAKELLLADDAPERTTVTLLGRGAKLVGQARRAELTREDVERIVLDGFLPFVEPDAPVQRPRAGIVAFGLPYAADAAITRHVAAFIRRHQPEIRAALGDAAPADPDALAWPDALLLNGGVFRGARLAERLQQVLARWRGAPAALLDHGDPDVAVARGAVAQALARHGHGPRLGGGSARSYFLLLDPPAAADDTPPRLRAVCVLARGTEPGVEQPLAQRRFTLTLGRPVTFQLASTTADDGPTAPRPGDVIELDAGTVTRLPPLLAVLPPPADGDRRREVEVHLLTLLTEVGTLQMHAQASAADGGAPARWQLEFELRRSGSAPSVSRPPAAHPRLDEAVARLDRVFGARARDAVPKDVRQLRTQLEALLGPRERWPLATLRPLYDALWARAKARRRSAEHERQWLSLAGWCLRPGFGDALDDWRLGELWSLHPKGVQHGHDVQVCAAWWTLWRRVAGGLADDAQRALLDDFAFNLQELMQGDAGPRPPQRVKGARDDMLRLGGALERVPAAYKAEIGQWLLDGAAPADPAAAPDELALWTLGRLGARQPVQASLHAVVAPEVASAWLDRVLALDWQRVPVAAFTAAQLARRTGDRARDLDDDRRQQVIDRLQAAGASPGRIAPVREVVALDEADQRQLVGDELPAGLKLVG